MLSQGGFRLHVSIKKLATAARYSVFFSIYVVLFSLTSRSIFQIRLDWTTYFFLN